MTAILGFYSRKRDERSLKKLDNAVKESYYLTKNILQKEGWDLFYHDGWGVFSEKGKRVVKLGVRKPATILKKRTWDVFNLKNRPFYCGVLTLGICPGSWMKEHPRDWKYVYGGKDWMLPSDTGKETVCTNCGALGIDFLSSLKDQKYVKGALTGHTFSNWLKKELDSDPARIILRAGTKRGIMGGLNWFEDIDFCYIIGTNKGMIAGNRHKNRELYYYKDKSVFVVSSRKEAVLKLCSLMNLRASKIKNLGYKKEILFCGPTL